MIAQIFAFVLAATAPQPTASAANVLSGRPPSIVRPARLNPAEWLDAPDTQPGNRSLARYRRIESDGSSSILNLTYEKCNCTPTEMAQTLRTDLASAEFDPHAVTIDKAKMCGRPAARIQAMDVATASNNILNFDAYIFGEAETRYIIFYFYRSKHPDAAVARLMPALCPTA